MTSPAQRFRERKLAKQQKPQEEMGAAVATAYEKQLMQLAEDKHRLKAIQSVEKKAELKAELLPKYLPWIEGVLESDAGNQDDVFMTTMVWAFDAGQYEVGLNMADYAIRHKLVMPDQYQRTTATVVAEEIADTALRGGAVSQETLFAALAMTASSDMPDEVRAKLNKAIGNSCRDSEDWPHASAHYQRALELNPNAGCKKDLERAERELKKTGSGQ